MDNEKVLEYSIVNIVKTVGETITVPRGCNGWTAINKGGATAWVNGMMLKPYPPGHPEISGEAYGVAGNRNEVYVGDLLLVFDAAASDPFVVISYKFYIQR